MPVAWWGRPVFSRVKRWNSTAEMRLQGPLDGADLPRPTATTPGQESQGEPHANRLFVITRKGGFEVRHPPSETSIQFGEGSK